MTKSQKLQMCIGCRNNFYNGNNDLGVKECWHLKAAKPVLRKRVGIWETPPWESGPEKILSCRTESGYVFVGPKQTH